jgi:AcrR family transcriptional regulator
MRPENDGAAEDRVDGGSPPEVPTARRRARLTQVLDAATSLFERQGYYETTMQEIAAQAGISVGLIYQYAQNKEEVLSLVITENLAGYSRELRAAIGKHTDPVERVAAGFAAYCAVVDARRHAVLLAYRETKTLNRAGRERLKALETATNAILVDEIEAMVAAGLVVPVDAGLLAHDLMAIAHSWALKHWSLAPHNTLERFVSFHTALILRSLLLARHRAHYEHLIADRFLAPIEGDQAKPS